MEPSRAEEQIHSGAEVVARDGDKLGTVGYVVIRPPDMTVTDVVVNTGGLLGRDVVLPIDTVDRVEAGKVHLTIGKDELEKHPDYIEVHYQQPPEGWVAPPDYAYAPTATLWPAEPYTPELASVTVNAPAGTVGIREGMEVESSDGHKVGSVDGLDVDPKAGHVTAIVVKEGFLFTHDVRIPIETVSHIEDEKVRLSVTRDEAHKRFG